MSCHRVWHIWYQFLLSVTIIFNDFCFSRQLFIIKFDHSFQFMSPWKSIIFESLSINIGKTNGLPPELIMLPQNANTIWKLYVFLNFRILIRRKDSRLSNTATSTKIRGWTHVLRKGNISCSISDIRHATFVKMPVINHKSRKEDGMVTITQRNISVVIWPRYIVKVNKYSLLGPQLNCCRRM